MCGILTIYSLNKPVEANAINAGLNTLHHRGPDNNEYWISGDREIGLGHTRLSIIDLNTGDQPISNQSETLHLVANGEFYDFENIRDSLKEKGHKFKTQSDSEIALHLYAEYGTSCLHHLRGEFAFCLWDSTNHMLFAARDRFGIKPLFYTVHAGKLYIASEIKALLAAGVPSIWDYESYRTRAFIYRDRTLFKNIHQIPPGHFLIATKGGIRLTKYWDFNYPEFGKESTQSEETAIEDIRNGIIESIKTRLRSDVPVGVYLSGGIDSSAVLGIAAEQSNTKLDTFTLSFDHEAYDEFKLAEQTAKHVGANFNPISITQSNLADAFSDTIWHSETTCINAHGVAKYLLSKAVHEAGYKVVLTGEGADEIFAGYAPFRQDNLLHNKIADLQNDSFGELFKNNLVSSGTILSLGENIGINKEFLIKALGFAPSWMIPQLEMTEQYRALFHDEFRTGGSLTEPLWQFINHTDISNQVYRRDPVHISMYLMSKSMLPNYILTNLGDRMEMANSIEGRVPFLDHHLVEKATQLPMALKIKNTREKYVLREAAKPYISDEIYQKEKHPFLAPPSIFNPDEPLHQFTQDVFHSSNFDNQPFFDKEKVLSFMSSILLLDIRSQIQAEPIIMEILSACILGERFELTES